MKKVEEIIFEYENGEININDLVINLLKVVPYSEQELMFRIWNYLKVHDRDLTEILK